MPTHSQEKETHCCFNLNTECGLNVLTLSKLHTGRASHCDSSHSNSYQSIWKQILGLSLEFSVRGQKQKRRWVQWMDALSPSRDSNGFLLEYLKKSSVLAFFGFCLGLVMLITLASTSPSHLYLGTRRRLPFLPISCCRISEIMDAFWCSLRWSH